MLIRVLSEEEIKGLIRGKTRHGLIGRGTRTAKERWLRGSQVRLQYHNTWGVHVLRSPNLLFILKNYSPQEAENTVISQRNHPVDIQIFHNAHATIAWPQQTLL